MPARGLLALLLLAVSAPAQSPSLLLTGARVLDPQGTRFLEGRAVLVRGERIVAVAPLPRMQVPNDARRIDLAGRYLIPGLIDLHTHLLLHPYDETSWNDQVLKESLELRTIRATVAARASLEAGFTTLRDLGTEGAGFADVALRDAIARGMIPGPRMFVVTRAIVATGCYGPSGFDPRWRVPKGAQEADGRSGVRKAVRQQIAAGADWIKVYADYRRQAKAEATPTFSAEELETIVGEAHSAGLRVAAHASTDAAIRRAVLAGVRTIEHGTGASEATLRLMKAHDVVLCPTLAAAEAMARYGGWKPGMAEPARLRAAREMFGRALKSGVKIACGSDAGVFAHGHNAREIELMVAHGMSERRALAAATREAAAVLGREHDLGRIEAGCVADLVALFADPLRDIGALRRPARVIAAGRVVRSRH